mmetsp:Transcript_2505/g.6741  ORF Transcript_2505/g.6741 Transcript_2505/m.6741 type:complete len:262 (-) Transcript_2505:231-1016(-)
MHPRGRKLISPNGHTLVALEETSSPIMWTAPRTSWRVGVGAASLTSKPSVLIIERYPWISASSSVKSRPTSSNTVPAVAVVSRMRVRGVMVVMRSLRPSAPSSTPLGSAAHVSASACIVSHLPLWLPHSRLIASKTLGALRSFRLVSPSSITVDMKHSVPPAGCSRRVSAGNGSSFMMNSTSPTSTLFHVMSSNLSWAPFFPLTRRRTTWEFSALSSRRLRRSSYMSLHAVHSSTRKNGPSLLCHVFGDHGKTTITQMKRK